MIEIALIERRTGKRKQKIKIMTEMAMHAFTGIRKISPHLCPAKISVGTGLAEFSNSRACIERSL